MWAELASLLPLAIGTLTVYSLWLWFTAPTHQLSHIPTIGSSGVLTSYLDALRFHRHGHEMIREGYLKYRGGIFKVPMISRWMVVVTGTEMVSDIRGATDEQVSFSEAVAEVFQSDYTIGPQHRLDPYHIPVIRTSLTRSLGICFDDIKDEIAIGFTELVSTTSDEWIAIPAFKSMKKIVCRASNRLFVGLPLCRNPEYIELYEQFIIDFIKSGRIIGMFPGFIKPLVAKFLTEVPKRMEMAMKLVGPLFQQRIENEECFGKDRPYKQNDLVDWLVHDAKGSQREIRDLVSRLLSVNIAAIQTTTMAFTHILYDLATHPNYVNPLREEIESIIASQGWTKSSTANMHKLDSFIKESQRIAIGGLTMRRKTCKDFTFSNGVTLPVGTNFAVATNCIHMDKSIYKNPTEFMGFRFAEMRGEDGEQIDHQMVSLSLNFGTFGIGRHACPGRFFAANMLKIMLTYVLLNYDIKLAEEGFRPPNIWLSASCIPNPAANVLFRKRQDNQRVSSILL